MVTVEVSGPPRSGKSWAVAAIIDILEKQLEVPVEYKDTDMRPGVMETRLKKIADDEFDPDSIKDFRVRVVETQTRADGT